MSTRVLIIAHEQLERERIRGVLGIEPDIKIIAECANEREAMAALLRLRADLLCPAPDDCGVDKKYLERVAIKSSKRVFLLKTAAIEWIAAESDYVRFHFEGQTCLLREKMKTLEARLNPAQFIRIHRSTIVNLDCVKEMRPRPKGEYTVLLRSGTQLTLSRRYRDQFFALIEQWS